MKTIIAGSRKGVSFDDVERAVESCPWKITEVVSGNCRGVDRFGETMALRKHWPIKKFIADWDNIDAPGAKIKTRWNYKTQQTESYNVIAGFQRNEEMANYVAPDGGLILLVYNNSPGSLHMLNMATKAGIKIYARFYESVGKEIRLVNTVTI